MRVGETYVKNMHQDPELALAICLEKAAARSQPKGGVWRLDQETSSSTFFAPTPRVSPESLQSPPPPWAPPPSGSDSSMHQRFAALSALPERKPRIGGWLSSPFFSLAEFLSPYHPRYTAALSPLGDVLAHLSVSFPPFPSPDVGGGGGGGGAGARDGKVSSSPPTSLSPRALSESLLGSSLWSIQTSRGYAPDTPPPSPSRLIPAYAAARLAEGSHGVSLFHCFQSNACCPRRYFPADFTDRHGGVLRALMGHTLLLELAFSAAFYARIFGSYTVAPSGSIALYPPLAPLSGLAFLFTALFAAAATGLWLIFLHGSLAWGTRAYNSWRFSGLYIEEQRRGAFARGARLLLGGVGAAGGDTTSSRSPLAPPSSANCLSPSTTSLPLLLRKLDDPLPTTVAPGVQLMSPREYAAWLLWGGAQVKRPFGWKVAPSEFEGKEDPLEAFSRHSRAGATSITGSPLELENFGVGRNYMASRIPTLRSVMGEVNQLLTSQRQLQDHRPPISAFLFGTLLPWLLSTWSVYYGVAFGIRNGAPAGNALLAVTAVSITVRLFLFQPLWAVGSAAWELLPSQSNPIRAWLSRAFP